MPLLPPYVHCDKSPVVHVEMASAITTTAIAYFHTDSIQPHGEWDQEVVAQFAKGSDSLQNLLDAIDREDFGQIHLKAGSVPSASLAESEVQSLAKRLGEELAE